MIKERVKKRGQGNKMGATLPEIVRLMGKTNEGGKVKPDKGSKNPTRAGNERLTWSQHRAFKVGQEPKRRP